MANEVRRNKNKGLDQSVRHQQLAIEGTSRFSMKTRPTDSSVPWFLGSLVETQSSQLGPWFLGGNSKFSTWFLVPWFLGGNSKFSTWFLGSLVPWWKLKVLKVVPGSVPWWTHSSQRGSLVPWFLDGNSKFSKWFLGLWNIQDDTDDLSLFIPSLF